MRTLYGAPVEPETQRMLERALRDGREREIAVRYRIAGSTLARAALGGRLTRWSLMAIHEWARDENALIAARINAVAPPCRVVPRG